MSEELVILRAADRAALLVEMNRLIGFLDRSPAASLLDVSYTASLLQGTESLAIVTDSVADLRARLVSARTRLMNPDCRRLRDKSGTYYCADRLVGEGLGKLAFVYPGVLSFYPDMMRDVAIEHAECRAAFEELEEALASEESAFSPFDFVFPPAPHYRRDADVFRSGAYAQGLVATYAACAGMTRILGAAGVRPDAVTGFAGGDLAAMLAAGVAGQPPDRATRLKIIRDIYAIVDKAVNRAGLPEAAMISVLLRHEGEADEVLAGFPPDKVVLSVDLSPRLKSYAVVPDFETEALAAFAAAGIRTLKLALDRPFNTPLCESMVPMIRKFADGCLKRDPTVTVYSCATMEPVPTRLRKVRAEVSERWARPVRFGETVRRMYDDGVRVFLEVGPRGLITTAVDDALKGRDYAAIATNSIHRRGLLQLRHALAQLVTAGAPFDATDWYRARGAKKLDFDSVLPETVRRETEMRLSRALPRLALLSDSNPLAASALEEPKGRGAKVAERRAALARQKRLNRQFASGVVNPLLSDADTVEHQPGVMLSVRKTLKLADYPFINDFAFGTSQVSFTDHDLRGLVILPVAVSAEIMAEAASMLVPGREVVALADFSDRHRMPFDGDAMTLSVRAERVASDDPAQTAVKVQIRADAKDSDFTWPLSDATVLLAAQFGAAQPVGDRALAKSRTVHWTPRDIYPDRLCCGRRIRGITFVETWSESGLDYEVTVPAVGDGVRFTPQPNWQLNPLLLQSIVSGFILWRSAERFSFPCRFRRIDLNVPPPQEGAHLRCYLRLTGVTPRSHLCDITVSDGNGGAVLTIAGWEEIVEFIRPEYRGLIMQPATAFITQSASSDLLGSPTVDVASAFVTDIPYPIFERDEEIWLKTFSHIVLSGIERADFARKTGSAARRAEWLFGRIAAKEAIRRYMVERYQARWSYADVTIQATPLGKPYAVGDWSDYLPAKLDIAIAHTSQFVIALAAANARVGVDVESAMRDLSQEFADGVFTPDERNLTAGTVQPAQTTIRFWCAKEAVSKALGTGIRYSPKDLVVTSTNEDATRLTLQLRGAWEEAFRKLKGRDIPVTTRLLRDHALAFCFIPASLFDEE